MIRASLWMLGAATGLSTMAIAGREASVDLDTFEMMTYRSVVGLTLVILVAWSSGRLAQIRFERFPLHVARNITHFTGQNLWFMAITLIPFAQVFALEFTTPFWVILFAALFLGEAVTRMKVLATTLGFLGILIITRPWAYDISWGMISALAAAVFFAATAVLTKRLTRDQSMTQILFWLTGLQLLFGLVICLWDGSMALPSAATAPWVILMGFCGVGAHYCLTTALSLAPASIIMPIDLIRLPAIALIGAAFYAEPLEPVVWIGAAFIITGNLLNVSGARRG